MTSCMQTFIQQVFIGTCYVPGTLLSLEDIAVIRTDSASAIGELIALHEMQALSKDRIFNYKSKAYYKGDTWAVKRVCFLMVRNVRQGWVKQGTEW